MPSARFLPTSHRVAARTPRSLAILAAALGVSVALPGTAAATCIYAAAMPAKAQVQGAGWKNRREELLRRQAAHRYGGSVAWKLGPEGVELCRGTVATDANIRYRVKLVAPVWARHGAAIAAAARRHGVPAELILTALVEESGGRPGSIVRYPGYVSDAATPQKISIGVGQMLLSTARRLAPGQPIDRAWLLKPENAIDLVARYFALVYRQTGFDPPLAAAAYNGGGVRPGGGNRWNIANPRYVESFVAVFNASVAHLAAQADRPRESFAALFAIQASDAAD
ncbi:MAG: lytic transglycosylase domain-containing protein [Rhodospirillaceae bacterium]|nr:lytic transglycosylase domain-containing protein [Rhodospirillaceae bacterium]